MIQNNILILYVQIKNYKYKSMSQNPKPGIGKDKECPQKHIHGIHNQSISSYLDYRLDHSNISYFMVVGPLRPPQWCSLPTSLTQEMKWQPKVQMSCSCSHNHFPCLEIGWTIHRPLFVLNCTIFVTIIHVLEHFPQEILVRQW